MLAASFVPGCEPEAMTVATVPVPKLPPGCVLVKVAASALNRADTLQRKGTYAPPAGESELLGLEASGMIESVSPMCDRWQPGTRVMALLSGGGNAQFVPVPMEHLMTIPDNLSLHDAAAIPEAWLTAFQLLSLITDTKAGDTVLIHAGASGVGTAAIQLVTKVFGAKAIATVGSEEKAKFALSCGAQHAINYKTDDWVSKVHQLTDDCVGASYWQKNAEAMAVDGRWALYGWMGGFDISGDLLAKIVRKRIRLQGTTLRSRSNEYKANLIADFAAKALPLFATGELKPVIDSTFPLADIGKAHRRMEDNLTMGKIILDIP